MNYNLSGFSVHGISRQEYRSGLPFPSPGDLPYPGMEPGPPSLQADALPLEQPAFLCFIQSMQLDGYSIPTLWLGGKKN